MRSYLPTVHYLKETNCITFKSKGYHGSFTVNEHYKRYDNPMQKWKNKSPLPCYN